VIVLDPNVLSELLRPAPNRRVVAWLDAQPRSQLFTTVVSRAELLYGAHLLPDGQRRRPRRAAAEATHPHR
jgi:predicted nucleic acid-binding protein